MRPSFHDAFWSHPALLPSGMELERTDSLALAQPGPSGALIFDVANLKTPSKVIPVLVVCREKLVPADVVRLAGKLRSAEKELSLRGPPTSTARALVIATQDAGPRTLQTCEREGLGLIDSHGTFILSTADVLLRVTGNHASEREARAPSFHGKGARIVRTLLNAPSQIRTIRAIAADVDTSYANAFEVVRRLEQAGFVHRKSPRSGVILRDPVGLLRAWLDSGERTAATVEAFNARATSEEALRRGLEKLAAQGIQGVFTLGSALEVRSAIVSALPHGVYTAASSHLVQEAFELRRQTPHNFFLLRPEPLANTDKGGVAAAVRKLASGPAVAVPQLIVDLYGLGGRAKEQAESLLENWARTLPLIGTS